VTFSTPISYTRQKTVPQGFLLTVTTLEDHNDFSCDGTDCTLREAIQAANNFPTEDTIDFAVTGTINLVSALPDISDSVAIEGPGSASLTVRRNSEDWFRIFTVTTTGTVTFSGLTLSNGFSDHESGGGIQNTSTGTVNILRSTISGNSGFKNSGGGVGNSGTGNLNIVLSTITDNLASQGDGGGIYNMSTGTVNVTDSVIEGNKTTRSGGAIYNDNGTVSLNNITISSNESESTGGGIMNERGTVSVADSNINDNSARLGVGGGVANRAGTLTITNSSLSYNSTGDGGGGILNVSGLVNIIGSTINNNEGSSHSSGGAILITDTGTVNITNSTITGNRVFRGIGGGIANLTGLVNVTNSTISDNSSDDGDAGGIFNSIVGTVNVNSSIIALNKANNSGPDVNGVFSSQGFNLIGKTDTATGFTQPTDQTGTIASPLDPKLDPEGLQDRGGPTQTIELQLNSPAIDKGIANGLTTDQRGTPFARTVDDPAIMNAAGGDGTDIGALEVSLTDSDGDGDPDVTDPDDDNDGDLDGSDNCRIVANPNQENNDGDSLGDACDTDDDNDGVSDAADNCQFTPNPNQLDTDGDGIGNACENDAPTIAAAAGVTRAKGSPASNSQIATVSDEEDAEDILDVTVNGANKATVNGVTINNIAVDVSGNVTADVVASCGASDATFTLRVTDSGGLFAEDTLNVTVTSDNTPPVVTSSLSLTTFGPPFNHDLINVGLTASATDGCDGSQQVNVQVFGDEDDETVTGNDGTFSPDAKNIAPTTLRLRRERVGTANGRVYLIVNKATDASGNTGFSCSTITVPLDTKPTNIVAVNAQASAARAFCQANNGSAPAGYFVIGDGSIIGKKQ
jgi:CSLREA domain-containing protein